MMGLERRWTDLKVTTSVEVVLGGSDSSRVQRLFRKKKEKPEKGAEVVSDRSTLGHHVSDRRERRRRYRQRDRRWGLSTRESMYRKGGGWGEEDWDLSDLLVDLMNQHGYTGSRE